MTHVCVFRWVDRRLVVDGQEFRFEWHDMFGPQLLGSRGQQVKAPPERSHFWDALRWWQRQGQRADSTGLCLWRPMPDELLAEPIMLSMGRHRRVVGYRVPAWAEGQGEEGRDG